ncbi:hypothetical protein ACET3Z_030639 [Daucus carota]
MKANKTSDFHKGSARQHGDYEQRPVAVWSKNWIIGRYNPEDTVHGLLIMGFGNLQALRVCPKIEAAYPLLVVTLSHKLCIYGCGHVEVSLFFTLLWSRTGPWVDDGFSGIPDSHKNVSEGLIGGWQVTQIPMHEGAAWSLF